jgi:hypothetical protein
MASFLDDGIYLYKECSFSLKMKIVSKTGYFAKVFSTMALMTAVSWITYLTS